MTLTITGETTTSLIGTPTTEGTYPVTLMVSDGNSSEQQYFEVEVVDSGGVDWHVVVQEGFTDGIASDVNLEINSIGVPYVMSANSNNEISVYTFENDSWSLLGNKITGEQGQAAMALAPDSTPYIITVNCLLKVYKYDGSNWTQVGGTVGNGYHMDITVANDGTPYVSYMDVTNNNFNIIVYPNPNSGHCIVPSNNTGKFQLFDIQGRVISEGILEIVDAKSNNYTYTFNHSNLSKGLYLLSIANEQKREVVKIIIE